MPGPVVVVGVRVRGRGHRYGEYEGERPQQDQPEPHGPVTDDGGRGVDIMDVEAKATNASKRLPFWKPQTQMGLVD